MANPAVASVATVELFRSALRALAEEETARGDHLAPPLVRTAQPPTAATTQVGHALRALCEDARAQSLRAEQVLILLKALWHELPEVRALPLGEPRSALLSRVIGLCLDEYYGTTHSP